jgi:hypothetical protein
MGKQHKDCRQMPLFLDRVEVGIDELIDALRYIKKDKDYSDIKIFNVNKLEFFGDRLLTDEEYKELLLAKQTESKYRIKIEQENLSEIENELKNIHVNIN